jgi:hypothetical protein
MASRTISNHAPAAPASRYRTQDTVGTVQRSTWALWGVPAAILGFASNLITADYGDQDAITGAQIIQQLDRASYHAGIILGISATLCLLITAAGWQRWAAQRRIESLAARLVPLAFTASAGVMMLGYGFMGSLAIYLPGGMDEEFHAAEGLYAVFMFLDFASFIAWWGVAFAAIGVAWLSLRERSLPVWIGAISVLFAVIPIGFMSVTGLPGEARHGDAGEHVKHLLRAIACFDHDLDTIRVDRPNRPN